MPERSAIGGASTTPDTDLASVPRWVLRGMIWFLALAACGGIATAVTLVMILATRIPKTRPRLGRGFAYSARVEISLKCFSDCLPLKFGIVENLLICYVLGHDMFSLALVPAAAGDASAAYSE